LILVFNSYISSPIYPAYFIGLIHRSSQSEITSLLDEVKAVLKVCGHMQTGSMFEKIVSKWIDIPITAKFLSMSEYVDAIIVIVDSSLAKGNNAYSVATMQGIMDIELHSYVPIVFRSICTTNCYNLPSASSYHIGKTAVEMALARWEALDAIAEFGQVERESGFVGSLIIVILVLVLVGYIWIF
jgi:6,7-dimethyl-8-ribityllumazine synthase